MRKLNYSRASYYLAGRFKEIRIEIRNLARHRNFAGVVQALVNYLKSLHSLGKLDKVSRYIDYLGKVYNQGNTYVQYIIENLFVRSLGSFQRRSDPACWDEMTRKMPKVFIEIYQRQMNEHLLIKH
ncbi:DUF7674 family protein [Sphingobacterium bambusae]|uniref:DUF7674 domain-containing protein n=1 Tax=Sphingobacterium bambusae TaxID=662858 RepID=A0ABW6BLD8_9SPHI|nr:hypothetical protein [Sphingobacterium bambusae]WPL49091.1 hypothetical protein SCB77_01260 [Sphingobacterium bambusae]